MLHRLLTPSNHPHFADTGVVTSGWDCTRAGYDVLVANPCDRLGRTTNYPRVWMVLRFLGLGRGQTQGLGLALVGLYAATLAVVCRRLDLRGALLALVLLLSPAAAFAVERGNNDVVVLAAVVAAASLLGRHPTSGRAVFAAGVLVLLATVAKLYPLTAVAALPLLARGEARRTAWTVAGAVVGSAAVYALATRHDLLLVRADTPQAVSPAFGAALTPYLTHPADDRTSWPGGLALAVGVAVLLVTAQVARRAGARPLGAVAGAERAGAVVAALLYVGTFVAVSSFAYRLVVLLPLLPLVVRSRRSWWGRVFALALVVQLWTLSPGAIGLAVGAGWVVFVGCGVLLTAAVAAAVTDVTAARSPRTPTATAGSWRSARAWARARPAS